MFQIKNHFKNHPLLSFFVLTFILSPLLLFIPKVGEIFVSWAPNAAALIVSLIVGGKEETTKLFKQFLRWKLHIKWFAIVIAIPIIAVYFIAVMYSFFSKQPFASVILDISIFSFLGLILKHAIRGPLGEEAGWRGFALPLLLKKHSFNKASIILGLIWSVWHFPFWFILISQLTLNSSLSSFILFTSLAIGTVALSVVISWVYIRTQSLLLAMFFHLFWNVAHELIKLSWDIKFALIAIFYIIFASVILKYNFSKSKLVDNF